MGDFFNDFEQPKRQPDNSAQQKGDLLRSNSTPPDVELVEDDDDPAPNLVRRSAPAAQPPGESRSKPPEPVNASRSGRGESSKEPLQFERFAEPDEDDDWDDIPDFNVQVPTYLGFIRERDFRGLLRHFAKSLRDSLFLPFKFFGEPHQNLSEAAIHLGLCTFIYAFLEALFHLNIGLFFTAFLMGYGAVVVGTLVVHLAFKKLNGKGTFAETANVMAFSRSTLVFAWITLGIPIGGIIAGLYTLALNIVGIEKIHQTDRKNTAIILSIIAAIGFALKSRLGW